MTHEEAAKKLEALCTEYNVNDVDKSALALMFGYARSEDDVDLVVHLAEYAIKKEYGKKEE